jgi:hypothetical protein
MIPNPYAPNPLPPYGGSPPGGSPPPTGPASEWTTRDLVSASWEVFSRHAPVLIAANTLVLIVVQLAQFPGMVVAGLGVVGQVQPGLVSELMPRVVQTAISIPFVYVATAFFNVGLFRLSLQAARGEEPKFAVIFSGADRLLPTLGLNLVMGLGIFVGFVLFIVPGVILSLGWSLAPYYVVDANLGPIEALGASWEATKGWRPAISLVFLAASGILLAGLACCCVGVIAAAPLAMVLYAMMYLKLRGNVGAEPPDPYQGRGDWPGEP